jgi:uncharacterized membrane protein HdeD (DUF308 family)
MSGFGLMPQVPDPTALPSHRWGWFVALGIVQIVVGMLCWVDVTAASFAGVFIIGALLVAGGIFQMVHAFAVRGWSGFLLYLILGALYIIGGFVLMAEPLRGSLIITLVIAVLLVVSGVTRLIVAATHRHMKGLWLVILSGVVSIVVGIVLYESLPWSSLWVLGTLIAIELIFFGIAWIQFGFALKKLHQGG